MIRSKSTAQDFHCELTNNRMIVDSDAPEFKGGKYNGFRPHELLESALASCINISIRMIAKEKNIKLNRVETQVDIAKNDDKTTFNYSINLGDDLNEKDKEFLMDIIDFCAVKQTLSKQLDFTRIEWRD